MVQPNFDVLTDAVRDAAVETIANMAAEAVGALRTQPLVVEVAMSTQDDGGAPLVLTVDNLAEIVNSTELRHSFEFFVDALNIDSDTLGHRVAMGFRTANDGVADIVTTRVGEHDEDSYTYALATKIRQLVRESMSVRVSYVPT